MPSVTPAGTAQERPGVRPIYYVIKKAVERGQRVDPETGTVYGMRGRPQPNRITRSQRYPKVKVYPGTHEEQRSVEAHKVVAFALFGIDAFRIGVEIRHVDGDKSNCRGENLRLGSHGENRQDLLLHRGMRDRIFFLRWEDLTWA